MGTPNLYSDSTEGIQNLVIVNSATQYLFNTLYSVPITAKKGDVINAAFRGEITNPQSYNVQVATFIKLGTTATDSALTNLLLPAAGENVTPAMHHMMISGQCAYEFTDDYTGFVNVVIYANSNAAGVDNVIFVDQGYGRLDVLHFEKESTIPPVIPVGSITLTAAQRQQILSAFTMGNQERAAAALLLQ